MRLIDADALKRDVCKYCNDVYSDEPCEPSDCEHMRIIDNHLTIDAVEKGRRMTKEQILQIEHDLLCETDLFGREDIEAVQMVHWISGVVGMTQELLRKLEGE